MHQLSLPTTRGIRLATLFALMSSAPAFGQLTDVVSAPNAANAGIKKSLPEQIGAGRGDIMTPDSSAFIIARDPFRAIVRGRQLFQRKFTTAEGQGPRTLDGVGPIDADGSIGAGLADSCGACHARPFGSAGFGGDVFTRPNSRDAPHLFGLGLQEMLADEITKELRAIRDQAIADAASTNQSVTVDLIAKDIDYGTYTAHPNGPDDLSGIDGVDDDLRVRPFFAEGTTISIREFLVGAFNAEMGLEAPDTDMLRASSGLDEVTPSGMELMGSVDAIEAPPVLHGMHDSDNDGVVNEIPVSLVDFMEFYLLNYFKPGRGRLTNNVQFGLARFRMIGCDSCHIQDLVIDNDRRVADVETIYDPANSNVVFNRLFATAVPLFNVVDDGSGFPTIKEPALGSFTVRDIFTDFKRHDLGPAFHELNFDGTVQTEFMTEPLWGVGSTPPYGHDGRSATLEEVILRHGGEAQAVVDRFTGLPPRHRRQILTFLNSLVIFAPPDTSSTTDMADVNHPNFPFSGKGSIDLSVLFNDTNDKE